MAHKHSDIPYVIGGSEMERSRLGVLIKGGESGFGIAARALWGDAMLLLFSAIYF